MTDPQIDDILRNAARSSATPDPALLERIAGSIQPTVRPVRPIASPRMLGMGFMAICAAVAVAGAAHLGFHGTHAMSSAQTMVFPALTGFITAAAAAWAAEMIPGSKRREAPWNLLCSATFTLWALFPTLFHDHHTDRFVHLGIGCLRAGMLHAAVIALAGWWLARRGFAVDRKNAALAAGTLAGLGGILMLELHCPNFQLSHLMVWHASVLPLSAALSVLVARLGYRSAAPRKL